MNRIQNLFRQKEGRILSFYCTAGFPGLEDTVPLIQQLEAAGADMVEIGIPFSDPLADGPVIQQSSSRAISNGMTLPVLFRQLKDIRASTRIPLVLMGYLNPILQFGVVRFCREAAACGIDGLIIPDLPLQEYCREWKATVEALGLNMIFLITPDTAPDRIIEIDAATTGFIYLVTSATTTGGNRVFDDNTRQYFTAVQALPLRNPLIAGFGIRNREDFDQVCLYTQGAIIGSGLIRALQADDGYSCVSVRDFVQSFLT